MQLLPVLQALGNQHEYIEILRDHPLVPASQLQQCEAILFDIELALEEVIKAPVPHSASEIKRCIVGVLRSIAFMEKNIAAHESDTGLPDKLRLRIAEAGLLALRFHLRLLTEALPTAADDTEWIH